MFIWRKLSQVGITIALIDLFQGHGGQWSDKTSIRRIEEARRLGRLNRTLPWRRSCRYIRVFITPWFLESCLNYCQVWTQL